MGENFNGETWNSGEYFNGGVNFSFKSLERNCDVDYAMDLYSTLLSNGDGVQLKYADYKVASWSRPPDGPLEELMARVIEAYPRATPPHSLSVTHT